MAIGGIGQRHVMGNDDIELHLTVNDVLKKLVDVLLNWGLAAAEVVLLSKNWPTRKLSNGIAYAPTTDTMPP